MADREQYKILRPIVLHLLHAWKGLAPAGSVDCAFPHPQQATIWLLRSCSNSLKVRLCMFCSTWALPVTIAFSHSLSCAVGLNALEVAYSSSSPCFKEKLFVSEKDAIL